LILQFVLEPKLLFESAANAASYYRISQLTILYLLSRTGNTLPRKRTIKTSIAIIRLLVLNSAPILFEFDLNHLMHENLPEVYTLLDTMSFHQSKATQQLTVKMELLEEKLKRERVHRELNRETETEKRRIRDRKEKIDLRRCLRRKRLEEERAILTQARQADFEKALDFKKKTAENERMGIVRKMFKGMSLEDMFGGLSLEESQEPESIMEKNHGDNDIGVEKNGYSITAEDNRKMNLGKNRNFNVGKNGNINNYIVNDVNVEKNEKNEKNSENSEKPNVSLAKSQSLAESFVLQVGNPSRTFLYTRGNVLRRLRGGSLDEIVRS
jgi:hypothetical protein